MMNDVFQRAAVAGLCVIALLVPASAAFGSGAHAPDPAAPGTTAVTATDPSDFSLTVSPTRLVVGPADNATPQQMKVINLGNQPLAIEVAKRDFTGAPDGTMVFQETAEHSASAWVTVEPSSFDLPAGATQIVTATIAVPSSPELGDHQVALVFVSPAGATDGNIKVNRGIGIPLYVTVPGATDDSATVSDLDVAGFEAGGPTTLTATVTNTGTVHRDFRGDDRLTVGGSGTAEPFPDFTVPRGAQRIISTTWEPPAICICHPSIAIVNDDGTVSEVSVRVIVFPWPWALGAIVVALGIWFGVRFSRRRYRASVARDAALLSASIAAATAPDPPTPVGADHG
jgi:hypothetical protein